MFGFTLLLTLMDIVLIQVLDTWIPQNYDLPHWNYSVVPWNSLIIFNMISTNLLFECSCWYGNYPTNQTSWVLLVISFPISAILFFHIHRLLHHPTIYRFLHYIHHEYSEPQAKVAYHAHPIEQVILNILPVYIPLVTFQVCQSDAFFYVILAHISGFLAHINWYDPGLIGIFFDEYHLKHHKKHNVNYGLADGYMDRIYDCSES
jgi:sterol desaturase/sphingolipid hydroxylase (fatty acid hydroxylase superfamily)